MQPQRARDVDRARKLVGLHADEPDHPAAPGGADALDDRRRHDAGVRLVTGGDADLDVGSEHPALRAIERETI
jgi:hypothetical protein